MVSSQFRSLVEETSPVPLCVLKGLVEEQLMEEQGLQDGVIGRSFSHGPDSSGQRDASNFCRALEVSTVESA